MGLLSWLRGRGTVATVGDDELARLALRVAETQAAVADMPWDYSPKFEGNGKKIVDACGGPFNGNMSTDRVLAVLATMDRAVLDAGLKEIDAVTAIYRKKSAHRELLGLAGYLAMDDYRAATGRDRKHPDIQKRRAEIEAAFDAWRG